MKQLFFSGIFILSTCLIQTPAKALDIYETGVPDGFHINYNPGVKTFNIKQLQSLPQGQLYLLYGEDSCLGLKPHEVFPALQADTSTLWDTCVGPDFGYWGAIQIPANQGSALPYNTAFSLDIEGFLAEEQDFYPYASITLEAFFIGGSGADLELHSSQSMSFHLEQ